MKIRVGTLIVADDAWALDFGIIRMPASFSLHLGIFWISLFW